VNLIANALRFTPPGGRVAVRLTDAQSELRVEVADSGVGIAADQIPLVFDRYRQAHTGHGGTGLGLAIVHAMVEAHGGRVSVESEEGKGSRFTVTLPRTPAGAREAAVAPA
jgi:signal transduction histidine kinase